MGDKGKVMRNFYGSGFLALESPSGVKHNFVEFPGVYEALLCLEFLWVQLQN